MCSLSSLVFSLAYNILITLSAFIPFVVGMDITNSEPEDSGSVPSYTTN